MTPRVVVAAEHIDTTVGEVMETNNVLIHGRIPVYADTIDDIRGLVLRSEILQNAAADIFDATMGQLMRDIVFCRDSHSVDEALDILLDNGEQILIVKDEFGGTTGIITMEDVIEELLGREIVDEVDEHEDMREFAREQANANGSIDGSQ
jgi:CBS domain containing-hemolysin-like protein